MPELTFNGTRVHYLENGSGEPVILIHSGGNTAGQWRGVSEHLGEGYRLLAIDLYGHGKSGPWPGPAGITITDCAHPVLALAEISAETCAEAPHLVGHSYGAVVALRAAIMAPGRFRSLTLFEPNAFSLLRDAGEAELFAEARKHAEADMADLARGAPETMLERFVDFWNLNPGMWAGLPAHTRQRLLASAEGIVDGWRALLSDTTQIADLKRLRLPTLVMGGETTHRTLERIREIVAAEIPGATGNTANTIPGAGHMAPITHPQPVADAIAAHLARRQINSPNPCGK